MSSTSIPIYTFSGTGNTATLIKQFVSEFRARNSDAEMISITSRNEPDANNSSQLIGIAAPVYALGVTDAVLDFVKKLPDGKGKKAFVCLTAGDGDNSTNRTGAVQLTGILRKRGYKVPYVRFFTMPSNWYYKYPDAINRMLIESSMKKAAHSVEQILAGATRSASQLFLLSMLCIPIAIIEDRLGAKVFGRFLKTSDRCTRCQLCVRECPSGNITSKNGSIKFGLKCVWCMKCIYRCPSQAIYPGVMKFCVLKEPYDCEKILEKQIGNQLTSKEKERYKKFMPYIETLEK